MPALRSPRPSVRPRLGWAVLLLGALLAFVPASAWAADLEVPINAISASGDELAMGRIVFRDSEAGLAIDARLRDLPPGPHGFHVHQNPACGPLEKDGAMTAGLAAGGHYDPTGTGHHGGPQGPGHLGDLPVLEAGVDGAVNQQLTAPRLTVADLQGRAIIVHQGGDNYADDPLPLGGGGPRLACGVVS